MKMWEVYGMTAATAFAVLLITAGLLPALMGVGAVGLSAAITEALP